MCLTIDKGKKPQTAEQDILCYKVYLDTERKLLSLYQLAETKLGKQPKVSIVPVIHYYYGIPSDKEEAIEEGYHSFTHLGEVRRFYSKLFDRKTFSWKLRIYECMIPKGTEFYVGIFETENHTINFDCYASEELIVLGELTDDSLETE